eukprot:12893275-Prorocentrum_lima.AAC.1
MEYIMREELVLFLRFTLTKYKSKATHNCQCSLPRLPFAGCGAFADGYVLPQDCLGQHLGHWPFCCSAFLTLLAGH